MPFLAISLFLLYANLIAAVRYIFRTTDTVGPAALGPVHLLANMIALGGYLFGMEIVTAERDGSIAGNAYNWAPVAFLACGVVSLVLFAVKFVGKIREPSKQGGLGFVFGMTVWALLASLYMCLTTIDHFLFFRDGQRSGQMAIEFSGQKMTCSGDIVIVRLAGDTAVYRCPQSVRLGQNYSQPFVPWPSYIQGSSTTLRKNIDAIMSHTSKPAGTVEVPASDLKIMPERN